MNTSATPGCVSKIIRSQINIYFVTIILARFEYRLPFFVFEQKALLLRVVVVVTLFVGKNNFTQILKVHSHERQRLHLRVRLRQIATCL